MPTRFAVLRVCRLGLGVTLGVALCGALGACTTRKGVVLPSGQQGYTVDCSGTNLSWSHCYHKAGKVCPKGYTVVVKSDNHGDRAGVGNLFGLMGGSVVDRTMLIRCGATAAKDTDTPAPAHSAAAPYDSVF